MREVRTKRKVFKRPVFRWRYSIKRRRGAYPQRIAFYRIITGLKSPSSINKIK